MSPLNSLLIKRFREMSAIENVEDSYKFLWMDIIYLFFIIVIILLIKLHGKILLGMDRASIWEIVF